MKIIDVDSGRTLMFILTNHSMSLDEALSRYANVYTDECGNAEFSFDDNPERFPFDALDLVSDDWEEGEL